MTKRRARVAAAIAGLVALALPIGWVSADHVRIEVTPQSQPPSTTVIVPPPQPPPPSSTTVLVPPPASPGGGLGNLFTTAVAHSRTSSIASRVIPRPAAICNPLPRIVGGIRSGIDPGDIIAPNVRPAARQRADARRRLRPRRDRLHAHLRRTELAASGSRRGLHGRRVRGTGAGARRLSAVGDPRRRHARGGCARRSHRARRVSPSTQPW